MIKPTHKPTIYSDGEISLVLIREEADLSDVEEKALSEGFLKQTSPHITVLSNSKIEKIKEKLNGEYPREKIEPLISKFDWSFEPKEVYRIKKTGTFGGRTEIENRESYIRLIDMPDMQRFYDELNIMFGTNLLTQVPHITLFTKGDSKKAKWRGIPVSSKEDFAKLSPIKI